MLKCNEAGNCSYECPNAKKADDEKQLLTNGNDDKDYEDYEDDLGD